MSFNYPSGAWFTWYDGEKAVYGNAEAYQAWLKDRNKTLKRTAEVCECGGDAVKAAFHSDYCPKYENT